jgi:drug/metabolite transporter (DMT)-like permease
VELLTRESQGLWLGLLGVVIFSITLPATRIAVASMDPMFVGIGRSVLAAHLAVLALLVTRQRIPTVAQFKSLAVCALGVIFGFPALTSWAMQQVPSSHGAVVVGLLPLATVIASTFINHERPSGAFWLASAAGSALVVAFAFTMGAGALHPADLALLGAVALGGVGYAAGAKVTRDLGGWQTISWALVISVPVLLPVTASAAMRTDFSAVPWQAWAGFVYVALFSQYLGFFAWYRGLDLGGVARVSQVQLLQLFLTLGFAALLAGETITLTMIGFAVAVVAVVALGRRAPVRRA